MITAYRIRDITYDKEYPWHDPNEIIDGIQGMVEAQKDIYGPNYRGTVFEPSMSNCRTGKGSKHHCPVKDCGVPTEKCYTNGHLGMTA